MDRGLAARWPFRKSAGRVMIATVIVVASCRRAGWRAAAAAGEAGEAAPRARHRRGRRHRISANPARARRRTPRTRRPPRAHPASPPRPAGRPPRERSRQGQGRRAAAGQIRHQGDRNKGDRDKGGRDKAAAILAGATRAAGQTRQRAVAPAVGHQRSPARARPSGRSEFAVCKTGGAEGATRRQPQGSISPFASMAYAWSASVSINGCGTRGW